MLLLRHHTQVLDIISDPVLTVDRKENARYNLDEQIDPDGIYKRECESTATPLYIKIRGRYMKRRRKLLIKQYRINFDENWTDYQWSLQGTSEGM